MSIVIISQPEDVWAEAYSQASFKVEAEGEELSYQWQYSLDGADWVNCTSESAYTEEFVFTMQERFDGRQYRCVVSDVHGNKATTETATLSIRKEESGIVITKQPKDVSVKNGDTFYITVEASGEGLVYEWYYYNPNMDAEGFSKSSTAQGSTYSNIMKPDRNGFQVYCIITDAEGNSVQTRTATAKCLSVSTKIQKHDLDVTPEDLGAMSRSGLLKATLLTSGWTETVPYTQVLTIEGVKEDDVPIISCGEPATLDADSFKALDKNYPMINKATVTAENQITFYCYVKKPTIDIPIFVKV